MHLKKKKKIQVTVRRDSSSWRSLPSFCHCLNPAPPSRPGFRAPPPGSSQLPASCFYSSVFFVAKMSASASACPLSAWHRVVCGMGISDCIHWISTPFRFSSHILSTYYMQALNFTNSASLNLLNGVVMLVLPPPFPC